MSAFVLRATGTARAIDKALVEAALKILIDPEHVAEIRGVFPPKPGEKEGYAIGRVCPGKDIAQLIRYAEELSDAKGVYFCINPIKVGWTKSARKAAIELRRWLLIDLDPIRPDPDSNSTDAEKEATRLVAVAVMDWLSDQGWPLPLLIDSGNGWHLLYRIDLPNTTHAQHLIRDCIKVLGQKFDTDQVGVDRAVHDACRISKLPGTWVRKGENSSERPHRMAKIQFAPETVEVVSTDKLAALAGIPLNAKPVEPIIREEKSVLKLVASSGSERAYARAALERECARVRLAMPGPKEGRNNVLNKAAYSVAGYIPSGAILQQEVEAKLYEAAIDSGLGEVETWRTIRSGITAGMENPREIPEAPGAQPKNPAAESVPEGELIIVRASSILPKKVEWLWPGRIPLGKLTTFAGVGGLGKTFVLCDITARVTTGKDWPDSNGECCEPGQVLFVSGEDDPDDTLVPRLIEVGADLNRVAFLRTEVQDKFTLADLKTLDKAIEQIGKDVRFVAIDPPTAYLGGIDDHKNAELRSLLSPLKNWAAKNRVALVFNTHVNKPQGTKVEAMMRVMGSVAWVNAVRAAHMFAKDPEDHERRLFCGMKLNIGKERKGMAYKIASVGELARVEWLGEVDITADEAVNKEKKKRSIEASVWLEELFVGKEEIPSEGIWKRKDAETKLSTNAVKEAKEQMGIRARQVFDDETGTRGWFWYWPPASREKWLQDKRALGEKAANDDEETV